MTEAVKLRSSMPGSLCWLTSYYLQFEYGLTLTQPPWIYILQRQATTGLILDTLSTASTQASICAIPASKVESLR